MSPYPSRAAARLFSGAVQGSMQKDRLSRQQSYLGCDIAEAESDIRMIAEYQAMLRRQQRRQLESDNPDIKALGEKYAGNTAYCIQWSGRVSAALSHWIERARQEFDGDLKTARNCRRRFQRLAVEAETFRLFLDFLQKGEARLVKTEEKARRLRATRDFLIQTKQEIRNADYMALDDTERN